VNWNIPLRVTVPLGSPAAADQAINRGQPLKLVRSATATNGNGHKGAAATDKVSPPAPPIPDKVTNVEEIAGLDLGSVKNSSADRRPSEKMQTLLCPVGAIFTKVPDGTSSTAFKD
jgi:hypothetical protein